ncbi:MAG: complex I NDUFA9 subunit family protein [Rhodospirillales bacterium]|nr:complex I NDUFA9 subunit family protein [Rhodospirillales bacterium]
MERRVVTVFGGSGFIGRHLVQRLAAGGWIVRAAVRDLEAAAFLKVYGDPGQVVPILADVTDERSVTKALDGARAAVNLVGILYQRGRRTFRRVHVEAAGIVAGAAMTQGVQSLVHVSALGSDPASPSEYARTKAAGEAAVRAAFPRARIVRPSVVFGPEDAFFNRFAAMARVLPVLPVFTVKLQPVYVGDVAEAIDRLLDDNELAAAGKTFELGGPRVIDFHEVMQLTLAFTGRHRRLIPIPLEIAAIQAFFLEALPVPPLTRDQIKLLGRDNVVDPNALSFGDLGIEPTAVEVILPTYLSRYRPTATLRRMST